MFSMFNENKRNSSIKVADFSLKKSLSKIRKDFKHFKKQKLSSKCTADQSSTHHHTHMPV